ncbi:hypothetical protein [Caulobacter phage BL198]|uniref:Uncharacterized protein n=1 Tax=Caulobacter phage BL198 TaxID=3020395 RepID=A0AAF0B7Z3_9CAUD|nr:hypothetical protein [Caulobacter phage BL198]
MIAGTARAAQIAAFTPRFLAGLDEAIAMFMTDPSSWSQAAYAWKSPTEDTTPHDPEAKCFCMAGGIARHIPLIGEESTHHVQNLVDEMLELRKDDVGTAGYHSLPHWNDAHDRTVTEVITKLREVRELYLDETPSLNNMAAA